jgi:hypothetical protein
VSNPFDKPESLPTISWALTDAHGNKTSVPVGTRQGGIVVKAPEVVQSTGYAGTAFAGKKLFWANDGKGKKTDLAKDANGVDNKPIQQIVTVLKDKATGTDKALWTAVYPKSQFEAIQTALAGRAVELGDELYVTLTGFERSEDSSKNASKLYSAEFIKGQGVFAPEQAAAAVPAPPAPPAAAPAPPAPPAPAEAVLSNGFTATALRAAGWTEEQISALSAPAPAPAPEAVTVVPAVDAVVDAAAARQAKIDAMSPEDRAMLNLA